MMKILSSNLILLIQRSVRNGRGFWKEGYSYDLLDAMNFGLEEAVGYWPLGESYLFRDTPMGERRWWCIHRSYFERI